MSFRTSRSEVRNLIKPSRKKQKRFLAYARNDRGKARKNKEEKNIKGQKRENEAKTLPFAIPGEAQAKLVISHLTKRILSFRTKQELFLSFRTSRSEVRNLIKPSRKKQKRFLAYARNDRGKARKNKEEKNIKGQKRENEAKTLPFAIPGEAQAKLVISHLTKRILSFRTKQELFFVISNLTQ
ncbi:MAG: hypothetical protein KatS3mg031_3143 [Chitinophagales bacterium]|nr:MAG: hypothetical protein KatS3mg031_3143 [Chitinophagales bacterium]